MIFEIGMIEVKLLLVVILMLNWMCEIYDVFKWCCIYYWIDFLNFEKEVCIVFDRVLGVFEVLVCEVVGFV